MTGSEPGKQARKQTIADQASSGRLMSGVSDYPLTDLQTQYEQGMSGIQGNLASSEAAVLEAAMIVVECYRDEHGECREIAAYDKAAGK